MSQHPICPESEQCSVISRSYSNAEEDKDEMTALSSTTIPPSPLLSVLFASFRSPDMAWNGLMRRMTMSKKATERTTVESVHPLPRAKGRDEGVVETKDRVRGGFERKMG